MQVELDLTELFRFEQLIPKLDDAIKVESRLTTNISVDIWEALVVGNTPTDSGLLLNSIGTKVIFGASAILGSVTTTLDPIYGEPVEYGRKPGKMPPSDAIKLWVIRKLGLSGKEADSAAFLIARAIGRRGTKAARMFQKGYKEGLPIVLDLWDGLGNKVIVRIFS